MPERVARVGRRPALIVEQQPRRERLAACLRHPRLAQRHRGGRRVEYHGRMAFERRVGKAERVAGEARFGAPEWRHGRRPSHCVDEHQRGKAGGCDLFAMRADAPHMAAIAQRHDRDAKLPCTCHRHIQHHPGCGVAETAITVIYQHRAAVADQARGTIEKQSAAAHAAQIQGQHADPVTVVPHQIGIDQMRGNDTGFIGRAAGRLQDRTDQGSQTRCGNHMHGQERDGCAGDRQHLVVAYRGQLILS